MLRFLLILIVVLTGCSSPTNQDTDDVKGTDESFNLEIVDDASGIAPEKVYTFVCELIVHKPSESTPNCADFGEAVFDIKWDSWSADGAHGRGKYSINDCAPDCASGTRHEALAHVTLKTLKTDGEKYFLTDFSFETEKPVLAGHSNVGSWDVSDFYMNVPEMRVKN